MVGRFGNTKKPTVASRVLQTCLVAPQAKVAPDRLVRLAERALPESKGNARLVGAALYRTQKYEAALKRWDEADKIAQLQVWDWCFLSMTHQRLGHTDDARRFLAKATDWLDQRDAAKTAAAHSGSLNWTERVELLALRREAENLVNAARP